MPADKDGKIVANWGDQDILGIPEARYWNCRIGTYRGKEQKLRVLAFYGKKLQQPYEITFYFAEYFHGPLSWVGAELCVGTPDELLNLYRQLGKNIDEVAEKRLSEGNFHKRLYRFDAKVSPASKSTISIVFIATPNIHIQKI
jgi:hypothetical protein